MGQLSSIQVDLFSEFLSVNIICYSFLEREIRVVGKAGRQA